MNYTKLIILVFILVFDITKSECQTYKSKYSKSLTDAVNGIIYDTGEKKLLSANSLNAINLSCEKWNFKIKSEFFESKKDIIGDENYKLLTIDKNKDVEKVLKEDIVSNVCLAVALKDKDIANVYLSTIDSHLRTNIKFLRYLSCYSNIYYNVSPKLMSKYGSGNNLVVLDTKLGTTIVDAKTEKSLGTIDERFSTIYVDASNNKLLNIGLMSNTTYCDNKANMVYATDKYGRCISIEITYPANNHEIRPEKQTKLTKNYFVVKKALSYTESNDTWMNVIALDLGGSVNGANVGLVNHNVAKEIKIFETEVKQLLSESKYSMKQITYTVKMEYEGPNNGLLSYRPMTYKYFVLIDGKVVVEKHFINVKN